MFVNLISNIMLRPFEVQGSKFTLNVIIYWENHQHWKLKCNELLFFLYLRLPAEGTSRLFSLSHFKYWYLEKIILKKKMNIHGFIYLDYINIFNTSKLL